jgi:hypothetical protein
MPALHHPQRLDRRAPCLHQPHVPGDAPSASPSSRPRSR